MGRHDPRLDDEVLMRAHVAAGRSPADIARIIGCGKDTVRRSLHRLGIEWELPGSMTRPAELDDVRWLADAVRSSSCRSIAAGLGCSVMAVTRALRRHGIPVPATGSGELAPFRTPAGWTPDPPADHRTMRRYDWGCRCAACVAANTEYYARRRLRLDAQTTPPPE
jgi:uncharacterized metal-binding protein